MAILQSHGILYVDSIPTHTPASNQATLARLQDSLVYYWYDGSSWVTVDASIPISFTGSIISDNSTSYGDIFQELESAIEAIVRDGHHQPIVRGNDIEDVPPTVGEFPSPTSGDSASVYLTNAKVEYWSHNGVVWVKAFVVDHSEATNLGYTASPTNGTVTNDTGTDAILPLANGINAGLMSPAQSSKVDFITITQAVDLDDIETSQLDLVTLSGVSKNSIDLGVFSGSIISDNVDIKTALQELETTLGSKADTSTVTEIDDNVDDLITLTGLLENSTNLGTFIGSTISDNANIKTAFQELETAVEDRATVSVVSEIDDNVDDLITLSGVSENSTDLGTFTGSTISNNVDIKTALQELETTIESSSSYINSVDNTDSIDLTVTVDELTADLNISATQGDDVTVTIEPDGLKVDYTETSPTAYVSRAAAETALGTGAKFKYLAANLDGAIEGTVAWT